MAKNTKNGKRRRSVPPTSPAPGPAERAQPEAQVVKKGKLDRRVTVRFDASEMAAIEDYARREGFTVSLLLRRSMLQTMRRLNVLPPV